MVRFAQAQPAPPSLRDAPLPAGVSEALDWAMRTPREERLAWRERLVVEIEQRGAAFRASGASEA
eukprot:19827-Alexandrium_andersonii.AAC.1